MIVLTKEEVIVLHEKLLSETGGLSGVRDMGLLESAVSNCMQTFDEEDLYPTVIEKAAVLVFSICKNHPFNDGNKRTAILSMLVILQLNQIKLSYSQKGLIALGLGIADGTIDYSHIVEWITRHIVQ